MLFRQLLTGRLNSDFILVKDSFEFSWIWAVKEFIEEHVSKGNEVHFFAFENKEYVWLNNLKQEHGQKIRVYDFFSDPYGWFGGDPATLEFACSSLIERPSEDRQKLVVIDSLSYPIQISSLHSVCRTFKKLRECPKLSNGDHPILLLTVFHSALVDTEPMSYNQMNYSATSSISLEGNKKDSSDRTTMNVLHKTSSGKIMQETYSCHLDKSGKFIFEKAEDKPLPKTSDEPSLEMTTFKLSLKEQELESRRNLVLPYLKKKDEVGSGKIFYEPDERDDWDDEDPDDDLNI
ncbi:hypothetical protein AAG570_002422 [Ranatra chinensis]|uniref:Elongator complex protein 5 n=1 Tax=Ranatra chinensis TaxID=642074 RepID=A0ABD0YLM2_9HEMI